MNGFRGHSINRKYAQTNNAKALTGIKKDKMNKILIQRNSFEMAAHDVEIKFNLKKPTYPHTIETYADAFKRPLV